MIRSLVLSRARPGLAATVLLAVAGVGGASVAAAAPGRADQIQGVDADYVVLRALPRSARREAPAPTSRAPEAAPEDAGYVQVVDQDLRGIIAEYARQQGLSAQIGTEVRQRVVNTRIPLDRRGFLATLQRRFGIAAYLDGDTLVAAGKGEVATRLMPLGEVSFDRFKAELATAGIPFEARSFKHLPESASVLVTAPSPIVARVSGILDAVRSKGEHDRIRVLRFGQEGH